MKYNAFESVSLFSWKPYLPPPATSLILSKQVTVKAIDNKMQQQGCTLFLEPFDLEMNLAFHKHNRECSSRWNPLVNRSMHKKAKLSNLSDGLGTPNMRVAILGRCIHEWGWPNPFLSVLCPPPIPTPWETIVGVRQAEIVPKRARAWSYEQEPEPVTKWISKQACRNVMKFQTILSLGSLNWT